jgi:hypothetical protein
VQVSGGQRWEGEDKGGVRVDDKQILRAFVQKGLSDTYFGSEGVLF